MIAEEMKKATQDQQIAVANLREVAKKLGATGEIVRAEILESGNLIVMIEDAGGLEITVIGKRGALK